jgi:hypothetical protein
MNHVLLTGRITGAGPRLTHKAHSKPECWLTLTVTGTGAIFLIRNRPSDYNRSARPEAQGNARSSRRRADGRG